MFLNCLTKQLAVIFVFAFAPAMALAHGDEVHAGSDHHAVGGSHMAAMEKTRETLKAKLGKAYDEVVPQAKPEDLANGKKTYMTYCKSCHGESGKGDGAAAATLNPRPADFTDAFHANFYSDRARIEIIRAGSSGTAMSAWLPILKDNEIVAVYQYVRSLRPSAPAAGSGHQQHQEGAATKPKSNELHEDHSGHDHH